VGVTAALFIACATSIGAPPTGEPVALTSATTSTLDGDSSASISDLFGKWESDNGQGILIMESDGTYAYAVEDTVLSTTEKGTYQVIGRRLILTPTDRVGAVNGGQVQIRQDPLEMLIGIDSSGNLALSLHGSIYRKT
jgi:hypothetical protein